MPTLETLLIKLTDIKVIDSLISYSDYTPIDLSISNLELAQIDISNPKNFEGYVENYLKNKNAKIAFGGYNEIRNLYKQSTLFNDRQADERNIHIGMDIWAKTGTPIVAALDGVVYGYANNSGKGNYGPTIILEHTIENQNFYTLYGHLSVESIENLNIGTRFKKGQKLATLGNFSVNGGYAPHLHFQIIKNIEKNRSDYPGVCSPKDLNYYLENCPNPSLLLKI
nr:peptidoglycan DD-metalloendopeptidase family protein [uncultured Flavobacterium sp.]